MEHRDFPKTCCALICIMLVNVSSSGCASLNEPPECVTLSDACEKFPEELQKCSPRITRSTPHDTEMIGNTKITIDHFKTLEDGFVCVDPGFSMNLAEERRLDIMRNSNGQKYFELIESANRTMLLELLDDLLHYMNHQINATCNNERQTICFMKSRIQQTLIIPNHTTCHGGTKSSRILEGVFLPQDNSSTEKRKQYMIVFSVFQQLYIKLYYVLLASPRTLKVYTDSLMDQLLKLNKDAERKFKCDARCMEHTANKFAGKFLKRIHRLTKRRQVFKFYEALHEYIISKLGKKSDRIMCKLIDNLSDSLEYKTNKSSQEERKKDKRLEIKPNRRHKNLSLKGIPTNKWKVTVYYIYKKLVRKVNKILHSKQDTTKKSARFGNKIAKS